MIYPRIRLWLRKKLRCFVTTHYFRGCGRLVEFIDLFLRSEQVEFGSVNGIPFRFDYSLGQCVTRMFYGIYEPAEMQFIKAHLSPGATFIDVGANIGYVSAIGAGQVGQSGSVHAFEPVPAYFRRLSEMADSAKALGFRIVARQCALGDKNGTVQIQTSKNLIGWATIVPNFMPPHQLKESITVPMLRLDEYIAANQLHHIAVIKIDVEGAEQMILRGLANFLVQHKPIIVCEVCPMVDRVPGLGLKALFDYMDDLGYQAFRIKGQRLKPIDYTEIKVTSNIVWK